MVYLQGASPGASQILSYALRASSSSLGCQRRVFLGVVASSCGFLPFFLILFGIKLILFLNSGSEYLGFGGEQLLFDLAITGGVLTSLFFITMEIVLIGS